MKVDPATYDRVLESLADGVPVDWAALTAHATTADEQRRYRNLRLVARIAELHRTIPLEDDDDLEAALETPLDAAETPAPATWGHLQITKRLAVGNFGELYLAHDPQLNRDVALKLLRRGVSGRPMTPRLLSEARTLAKVRHPNVVTVHGADVREGRAGLWMELVNGRTLEAWIGDNGALGPGETIAIGQDICRALAAVHAAGLVHGDVKAQNVMREDGGRIVLMDFGSGQLQGTAATAGTPLYLAPEVLAGSPATIRSDIYSLGVLLFHLLTCRYPCLASDMEELRAAHAKGVRIRLRDLRPDLSGALVDAIERALEPDPALRFETAGNMERALAGSAAPSRAVNWMVVAALAAAAVLALVVAVPRIFRYFAGPRIESIAVLPFTASDGDSPAHLLTGLSNDVLRELQRFDLDVKRATPSARTADLASLERQLGTDAILRGWTSRVEGGRRLRVSVVHAGTSELWTQDYGLESGSLPSLARRIAQEAASALRVDVREGAPAPGRQTNYRAYDAYQRGRVLAEQRTHAELLRSLEFFKQAAELDQWYAEPWAGMADAYLALGVPPFGNLRPVEARRLAKEAALEALDRNPNLPEAHTSLAWAAALYDWDWNAAEARFKRAIDLNPQYALAHHWYANYLTDMGRFDEALAELRVAETLEPLSILIHRDFAWVFFCSGRYDDAIAQLRDTLKRAPSYAAAITLLARALAATGRHEEALAELEKVRPPSISPGSYLGFRGYIEAVAGHSRAVRTLEELRNVASREYVTPYYLALIYVALGQSETALTELENAYREQDATLGSVNVDPRFASLRGHARFEALVEKMRFPPRPK